MNDELKRAFVDETGETLTALNNELLELESTPGDKQIIDAIFRRAHTLKGNLGAMGFTDAAALAHAMEDLLDAIRDGTAQVTPEVMDVLFDSVDGLEATARAVETGEQPDLDLDRVGDSVRALLTADSTDAETTIDHTVAEGDVTVSLSPGTLPGADAALVLERLDGALDTFETDPSRDALLAGEYGETLSIQTDAPEDAHAALEGMRVVDAIEITDTAADGESASNATESSADIGISTEVRSIRVDADRLDLLHGLVETLVTARIAIDHGIRDENLDIAAEALGNVDKALTELQDEVMDMRLVPLDTVFSSLPRLVRDLSRDMEKSIDLTIEGADVELDRTIVNRLDDPLVHLLRNAIDHGIESPEDRENDGKDPTGQVTLTAYRDRDTVVIDITDDGGGMDPDAIAQRASERGVKSDEELAAMDDSELFELIFEPGFSTASEVTDVSGRGVGMDAVKTAVLELDGSIDVSSEPGEGTTVTLRLPVDIAIDDVLFVTVNGGTVGIPVRTVAEIDAVDSLAAIRDEPMVDLGDGYIPVIDLGEALATAATDGGRDRRDGTMLVRIRPEEREVALACDNVLEQEEVVIRPLEGILSDVQGLSGTTVLGSGNVVPIIDIQTL